MSSNLKWQVQNSSIQVTKISDSSRQVTKISDSSRQVTKISDSSRQLTKISDSAKIFLVYFYLKRCVFWRKKNKLPTYPGSHFSNCGLRSSKLTQLLLKHGLSCYCILGEGGGGILHDRHCLPFRITWGDPQFHLPVAVQSVLSLLKLWVWTRSWRGVLNTTLCDKVCQWLASVWWFSPGTPLSFTNKTDCHNITEILLKVALSRDRMVVGFITTYAISAYHHKRCEFEPHSSEVFMY